CRGLRYRLQERGSRFRRRRDGLRGPRGRRGLRERGVGGEVERQQKQRGSAHRLLHSERLEREMLLSGVIGGMWGNLDRNSGGCRARIRFSLCRARGSGRIERENTPTEVQAWRPVFFPASG